MITAFAFLEAEEPGSIHWLDRWFDSGVLWWIHVLSIVTYQHREILFFLKHREDKPLAKCRSNVFLMYSDQARHPSCA